MSNVQVLFLRFSIRRMSLGHTIVPGTRSRKHSVFSCIPWLETAVEIYSFVFCFLGRCTEGHSLQCPYPKQGIRKL